MNLKLEFILDSKNITVELTKESLKLGDDVLSIDDVVRASFSGTSASDGTDIPEINLELMLISGKTLTLKIGEPTKESNRFLQALKETITSSIIFSERASTGRMVIIRRLSSGEILPQIVPAGEPWQASERNLALSLGDDIGADFSLSQALR